MMPDTDTQTGVSQEVYLLECAGYFKIGISRDASRRRAAMMTGTPFDIKLLHVIKTNDARSLEKHWHSHFSEKRTRGEWFNLLLQDVEEFCAHETFMFSIEEVQGEKLRVRLSPQAIDLIGALGNQMGLSQASVLETAIRDLAAARGVKATAAD